MPTQIGTTVDFNETKVIFSSTDLAGQQESDLRWRLIQALQTTLEMETLFNIFFEQVQSQVSFDGFSYRLDLLDIDLHVGKQSLHSCSYRLITQQDYLGELTFYRSKRFPERELIVLEGLLNVIVFPLRNAIRYRDAVTAALADPLTGAGNRIALNNTLQREIELAKRYAQSMAVLMVDLDKFKDINDTFGHSCGDQVLKKMVKKIKEEIRGSDVIFRYGGEEFVVLLTNTDLNTATYIAERLRICVANLGLQQNGETVPTSVSIGLSILHPEDSVNRLLERADFAMYSAKNDGRNQVKVCTETAAADG
ncbi:MAG: GGDEF domain-containing protein [Pseudomonadales bacterium]|nr:GGDEF domain-containing protein [Pseudomonadales bacterium]